MNKRKLIGLLTRLMEEVSKRKTFLLALSSIVVFITTYILILPAFTLDEDEAARQGGIDVPAATEELVQDDAADPGEKKEDETAPATDSSKDNKSAASAKKSAKASDALLYEGEGYSIEIADKSSVLPDDTELTVEPIDKDSKEQKEDYDRYYRQALEAIRGQDGVDKRTGIGFARIYDISLASGGDEIEPDEPVDVTISYDKEMQKDLAVDDKDNLYIVHITEDEKTHELKGEVLDPDTVDVTLKKDKVAETTFEAGSFSVYAVVYTVDFHYEVNGQKFEYSIEGGSSITLSELAEAIGILSDTDFRSAKEFISEVADVRFSDESLVKVTRADGDWTLESLKPFDTEETLTITMENGDEIVVRVTDAQDPSVFAGKEVIIYYNGAAVSNRPNDGEARAMTASYKNEYGRTYFDSILESEANTNQNAHWKVEATNGEYYLKSYDGKYLKIDRTNVALVDNQYQATVLTIQPGSNPDYRIYDKNNQNNALYYCDNKQYPGFFCAYDGANNRNYEPYDWLYIREAKNVPDRAGDWLLYFDEDLTDIYVHVGETITLRPYNEWEWKEGDKDVQAAHWNVGAWNDWGISASDSNGDKKSTVNDECFEFTRYVKKDDQLDTHYWSVQGYATKTGEYQLTNTKNDHKITVHVVDGPPVNKPQTIQNTANIKVNLFDYDRYFKLDPSNNSNLANNNNNKSDSTNKMGGSNHFYFLSSGSGNNKNESWNSYTKDKANPNIVEKELNSEGYPVLNHETTDASLKYLFDTSKTQWTGGANSGDPDGMIAYPDVEGMFQKDSNGYYYYNSNTNYFYYDTDTGKSYLYEHTYTQTSGEAKGSLVNDKPIGFFPFHDYDATSNLYVNQNHALNHHVGLSMDIDFILPSNKKDEKGQDYVFDFSGDDDLWVFLEWTDEQGKKQSKLMLDLGGIHQPVTGKIDFTKDETIKGNTPYRLKVFYLERGGCDSNCSIRFNLPVVKDLTLEKRLTGLTDKERDKYKNEEFTYEVFVNNKLYNGNDTIRRDASGKVIEQGFAITNGQVRIKDGETVTITGLARNDTFYAAEEKSLNMDQFEAPHAERYYQSDTDASQHEEEIKLKESVTQGAATQLKDWRTPDYSLQDTEKVTFTNTLKEKDLEVDKKWEGEGTHPDEVYFTVSASVEDDNHVLQPYNVSVLKETDGTTDKKFKLGKDNNWRTIIEHLPVESPTGKLIVYDIKEVHVDGYVSSAKDLTADTYNYCNVDVVKLWPDDQHNDEVITVKLKNREGLYYAGTDEQGEAKFDTTGVSYDLTKANNYTHRFARLPYDDTNKDDAYKVVEVDDQNKNTEGLVSYMRNIIEYQLTNTPIGQQVDPDGPKENPEIHKRIDALRDGITNPDSAHTGEDLTDLYRLYLDYKINSLQDANGVDLLFVIDHSGSMNNPDWQGNPFRAPAVMQALNGKDGLISQFLAMNEKNQWAAVGFKGDAGENYYGLVSIIPFRIGDTGYRANNAGVNDSEVLSPWNGKDYTWTNHASDIKLDNEGASRLTDYTAGFWRAEQFLTQETTKNDGRKKVVVFISDGIPTLHIPDLNNTLSNAGTAKGSKYYRDADGGCPNETIQEFRYFVADMNDSGYKFGDNLEFYTIGFGGSMQTDKGSELLNGMLDVAYGAGAHDGHFMTITDTSYRTNWLGLIVNYDQVDYSTAANKLKDDLRTIMGMNESFSDIVIQDDLSKYVDLYGLSGAVSNAADILKAAKAKVTMTDPDDPSKIVVLWENGSASNNEKAKFTKPNGSKASIIDKLEYDSMTKTVRAVFDSEYKAAAGVTYTLSFDVKTTDEAYKKYAESGYDKYTSGDDEGKVITGDLDTDYKGTAPANSTSSGKEGFRSNDRAWTTYKHNDKDEEKDYPHPVVQVFGAPMRMLKIDQSGNPLAGAKFALYKNGYDGSGTTQAETANEANLVKKDMQSQVTGEGQDQAAEISVETLRPGTYYLVETETPEGYNSIAPIKIVVSVNTSVENGITSDTVNVAVTQSGKNISSFLTRPGIDSSNWVLKVQNTAGVELPHTGGLGAELFYILGAILTLGAGSALIVIRRRKTRMTE